MQIHRRSKRKSSQQRPGVVLVENALVISVFGLFLAGIMEFGHCYLVINTLNAAAKRSARYGACEGVTTDQVKEQINELLSKSINADKATINVKDAGQFDQPGFDPDTVDIEMLPNLELTTAKARKLFIVQVTVPYSEVALLPPFWAQDIVLRGQSVMRHE